MYKCYGRGVRVCMPCCPCLQCLKMMTYPFWGVFLFVMLSVTARFVAKTWWCAMLSLVLYNKHTMQNGMVGLGLRRWRVTVDCVCVPVRKSEWCQYVVVMHAFLMWKNKREEATTFRCFCSHIWRWRGHTVATPVAVYSLPSPPPLDIYVGSVLCICNLYVAFQEYYYALTLIWRNKNTYFCFLSCELCIFCTESNFESGNMNWRRQSEHEHDWKRNTI